MVLMQNKNVSVGNSGKKGYNKWQKAYLEAQSVIDFLIHSVSSDSFTK